MNAKLLAEEIIKDYCNSYNITVKDLKKRTPFMLKLLRISKGVSTSEMRQALARFIYLYSSLTQEEVAMLVGYSSHADVSNVLKKTKIKLEVKDEQFSAYYNRLLEVVKKYPINVNNVISQNPGLTRV